jgi:uncharacterized BrkB/YihY/UPF0761 family membrane protein
MLTILALAPVEAVLFAVFGTTLGKALYAINVRQSDGKPLSLRQAIARAFDVCVRGMGLGIAIVLLITNFVGYRTLRKTGVASWDECRGLSVSHGRFSGLRITLIALAWLAILGLVALGIYATVAGL